MYIDTFSKLIRKLNDLELYLKKNTLDGTNYKKQKEKKKRF